MAQLYAAFQALYLWDYRYLIILELPLEAGGQQAPGESSLLYSEARFDLSVPVMNFP